MNWLYLSVAILAEVIATSALKSSEGFTRPVPIAVLVIGYSLAFYMLSKALQTIPVGIAYAAWSGVGIVLVTLIGRFLFQQRLDLPAVLGIAFIVVGVIIMQTSTSTV